MSAAEAGTTAVLGKLATLLAAGAVTPGEFWLDWPDQGSLEANWIANSALLERIIDDERPIRDADAVDGHPTNDSGLLARERARLRAAGLGLRADGYWLRPSGRWLIDCARVLGPRARRAAARGQTTFALPEAAPVAALIAARVPDRGLRSQAAAWLSAGAPYHDLVRLCARAVVALDSPGDQARAVFRPKAAGEVEPMLALWPHVLVLPTAARLSVRDLIELRAFPVHPLGVVAEPMWADGARVSPSEYFFHDLDHARFKVREDLLAAGISIPDAYQGGSTLDPRNGRHRLILPFAAEKVGGWLWQRAFDRWRDMARVLARVGASGQGTDVARAAELLLFEMLHEKSLPTERTVLARALDGQAHVAKLHWKQAITFFGPEAPDIKVMSALAAARATLAEICR